MWPVAVVSPHNLDAHQPGSGTPQAELERFVLAKARKISAAINPEETTRDWGCGLCPGS